jgi:adenine-specific DNA methylase
MKVAKDISKLNFDSIPIEPFWNIGDEPENKMHKIHAYPAKFPAFITTKALEYAKSRGANVKVIADIFCGCGTTAYEASRNGKNFWGCDINPVATLIAQAKSKKYNEKKLEEYYKIIQETFINSNILQEETQNVNDRIQYWFKPTPPMLENQILCMIFILYYTY